MMGGASSRHDALNSPGYSEEKLSGDRLERMKACAEKASTSFPPKLEVKPYEGAVETEAGNAILERGRWANAHRKPAPKDSGSTGRLPPGFPTEKELDDELGGAVRTLSLSLFPPPLSACAAHMRHTLTRGPCSMLRMVTSRCVGCTTATSLRIRG
jgi:hypothetical protein